MSLGNISNSVPLLNQPYKSPERSGSHEHGQMGSHAVQTLGEVVSKLPGPGSFFIAAGKALTAYLAITAVPSGASASPLGQSGALQQSSGATLDTSSGGGAYMADTSGPSQGYAPELLDRIQQDGGEAGHQRLIESLVMSPYEADGHGRSKRSVEPNRHGWTQVPHPEDLNHPLAANETTSDGKFVKVGLKDPELVSERTTKNGDVVYRFKNARVDPDKSGSEEIRQGVALSTCFHKAGDEELPSVNVDLSHRAGSYLHDCSGRTTAEMGVTHGLMEIKVEKPVNSTLVSIESQPDSLLYQDSSGQISHLLHGSSVRTYDSVEKDGMHFEPKGQPPVAIKMEQFGQEWFLTMTTRSDYSAFTDSEQNCDIPFEGDNTPLYRAECCTSSGGRNKQDVAYIYKAPLDINKWFELEFWVPFGNMADSGEVVEVWKDGKSVAEVFTRTGANNHPQYGGGGYFAQFGSFDLKDGEQIKPAVVKFRNVNFDFQPTSRKYAPQGGLSWVEGQCYPNAPDRVERDVKSEVDKKVIDKPVPDAKSITHSKIGHARIDHSRPNPANHKPEDLEP